MKKIFYFLSVFALALVLGGGTANATIISPPLMEIDADAGNVIANTIKIKNDGADVQTYYLTVQEFKAEGELGRPTFVEGKTDIASWITFAFDSITLQAGQATTIPFTIRVPEFARPGGHYVAVFASTTPPTIEGSGVGVSERIGTLVLVRVSGQITESANIAEFSSDKDSYNMLPVNFTVRVENNGSSHIKPIGDIVIQNSFGDEATRIKVNSEEGNVLPNSIRKFSATWGSSEAPKTFWARYKQQKKDRAFGKYTADLTLLYNDTKTIKSEISFWVIPTERIIVNVIILVILLVLLVLIIKRYNTWLITKYTSRTTDAMGRVTEEKTTIKTKK